MIRRGNAGFGLRVYAARSIPEESGRGSDNHLGRVWPRKGHGILSVFIGGIIVPLALLGDADEEIE
jgi:hypothetical protein